MHSPWLLSDRDDAVAAAFRRAGFASQLAAQLPPLLAVMRGVRQTDFSGAVINCSYPDVTHPVLHCLGLAPTVGIGNAGMIHAMVQARLRDRDACPRLRTLAHHAHVSMVAGATLDRVPEEQRPRVFLEDAEVSIATILAEAPPIPLTRELNEITAAHAVQLIAAFVGLVPAIQTAAPGVAGLPGGWPVTVREGEVTLDLPSGLTREQVLAFNYTSAQADGVAHIGDDGTVYFTDRLQQALRPRWPGLTEPLHPHAADERYAQLRAALMETA
jgi:hypothetical protein